jgi:biotin transporter BioY
MMSAFAKIDARLIAKGFMSVAMLTVLGLSLYYGCSYLYLALIASMPVWGAATLTVLAGFLVLSLWAKLVLVLNNLLE